MSAEDAKKAAGRAAAELIENKMTIGLGTGSTAAFFIAHLGQRCRQGLKVAAVATSDLSLRLAQAAGIPLIDVNDIVSLDLTVDGADEIDPQKRMIKGGGGALFREKIIAAMSREMVVIIDEGKKVEQLGKFPLPVEISPFASKATLFHLEEIGCRGTLRSTASGSLFTTDNGNYIFDVRFPSLLESPELINERIRSIPGVIETGLFLNMAGRVITGHANGTFTITP